MATGGNPLARVFCILLLGAAPVALVTLNNTAQAQDGDASSLLRRGLELLRAGDKASTDEAVKVLRQALAAEPSNKQAMDALGAAEWRALLNLTASGQEGANVAKAIMDLAAPILPEQAFDEAELKKLVQTAVTDEDYGARFDAAVSLSRVYGEYAVPHLVNYLGSSNTEHKINAHITLMKRIGRDAVLPLNEALSSGDSNIAMMAAVELGVIGDERSLAALAEASKSDNSNVANKAGAAMSALASRYADSSGMSASDLYLRLAQLYYAGDYRVLSNADRPLVLWTWADGLQHKAVPRHLYLLKLAEEACYDSLRTDPANAGAKALLARVFASEKMASDAAMASNDDDLTKRYAAGMDSVGGAVAAMGWSTLATALGDALDDNDHAAATYILDIMPHVYGGADFTTDHAVVRATVDDSIGVRYAAAEAVMRMNGMSRISAFPDPDGFMNLVAAAAGEVIPRHVLVVDTDDARRNKMMTELANKTYIGYEARGGADGIVRASRMPGLDLILLSTTMRDMDPLAVIRALGENSRTKNIPIVMVGTDEDAANDSWRNLYKDKAKALTSVPSGPGLPAEGFMAAVAGSFAADSAGETARYKRSATLLDSLAGTDTGNALFNWSSISETLGGLLTADVPNDPPVRLNALRAMGNLRQEGGLGALVTFFAGTDDDDLKTAAANAIASVMRATRSAMDEGQFKALLAGSQSSNSKVRTAAFAALGAAGLTDEQVVAVAGSARPSAADSE